MGNRSLHKPRAAAQEWAQRMRQFSHESNVLLLAAQMACEENPQDLARELPKLIARAGCVPTSGIRMKEDEIRQVQARCVATVIDLLVVRLEAELHAHLAKAAGNEPDDNNQSLEALCGRLQPINGVSHGPDFKDLVLLSCIRNAVVHGDKIVRWSRFGPRLGAAGWTEPDLELEATAKPPRGVDHLLRFKKVARSIATQYANGPNAPPKDPHSKASRPKNTRARR